ncbi:hypothetical protein FQN60_015525 [Etheostoma spectabile]|uniref:Protein-L-isoaspartate(D-aspartate) O-methyltransferase n=1 Tax=Etheostoma spectabile TaxID=54343 RepID=A0A5J5CQ53_9PERO|nr:hypothetical protein FQN60_015525 [Etheostoma spectabile]
MPRDASAAPPPALEVVSFLGKTVGAGAALTAAVYLLRKVCLIMAWKSGGASHAELVNNLRRSDTNSFASPENGIIKSDKVYEVMLATDRAHFSRCNPYMDSPQSIGYQATISAPHMHAYALELLHDQLYEGAKALDVGSGSGILSVCFARMVGAKGKVIGIDHIKELVDDSVTNVKKDDPSLITSGRVKLLGKVSLMKGSLYPRRTTSGIATLPLAIPLDPPLFSSGCPFPSAFLSAFLNARLDEK